MRYEDVSKVGVVGAGQMGNGIAQIFAAGGYTVTMADVSEDRVAKGMATIRKSLGKMLEKERISQLDYDAALERISTSTKLEDLAECHLVVEAIPERIELKEQTFRTLDGVLAAGSILASNTSSISITRLASFTKRPADFIGMHCMNPVPLMKLIEVIRGFDTSDETCETINAIARKIGKTPVPCNDYPGFVSNRVLMPMINEAIFALYEGVAEKEAIDEIVKLGMNHPMGPLTLADFIGLDTCLFILEVLHRELGDDKYRPCPLLRKMVDAGHYGKKSGRGFYLYA